MRKLAVLVVLALVGAAEAYACSCAPVDLERDLPVADGAIIGSVLQRTVSGGTAIYVFRVEQVYKGEVDSRAEVVTPRGGAACGLELAVGDRIGLLLTRDGDVWRSGLCSQVDPADFLALTNVEDNALPPINWGGILVGVLVLGAGLFFLVRKSRSYRRLR
ncbi:MAG TPA: hypothetical protein VEW11_01065 [Gaiellaceae bacterium]|nr:hypothetical protein [Gaiellaceae bacterium]